MIAIAIEKIQNTQFLSSLFLILLKIYPKDLFQILCVRSKISLKYFVNFSTGKIKIFFQKKNVSMPSNNIYKFTLVLNLRIDFQQSPTIILVVLVWENTQVP